VPLIAAFQPHAASLGLSLAPVVIARGARVALGDEVGALLRTRARRGPDRRAARLVLAR